MRGSGEGEGTGGHRGRADSPRFVITGEDPEGHPRTIILWRETDLVNGKVVRRVHITLDDTIRTATILTQGEAVEVGEAILAAAR